MIRTFTSEQLIEAYNAAPKAVQDALSGETLVNFILGLQKNYDLHVDITGKVSDLIRNTLLGLMNPSEFFTGLLELGIPNETAKKLTNDLNAQVFIPLHKEITGDSMVSGTVHAEVPSYSPTITPPVSQISSKPEAVPAPTTNPIPAQRIPIPTYVMPPNTVSMPAAPIPPAPVPPPSPAAPTIPTFAAPTAAPEKSQTPTQADANREALGKIMKEYGVDPYREPVDEK